jgi:hypothetical protein
LAAHLARGTAQVGSHALEAGDGIAIEGESTLTIRGDGEVLLFDLPA